jgi:exopolyphosphatase / guanosine-5'-triphosphate,3'-diphosphate pyrophosphatase
LTFDQIELVSRHLAGLDIEGRAANPCVGRERADLVLSGCAILDAICSTWPVGRLRVADRGVREGILFDLMHGRHDEPLSRTPGEGGSPRQGRDG